MPYSGMKVRSYGKPYPRVHHVRDASWCGALLSEGPEQCEVLWDGSYGPDCELTRDIVKAGTLAAGLAAEGEALRRRAAHAARPKGTLSMGEAVALHKKMERKPPPDDLADRLKAYSVPELKSFAVSNGVWDAKYATMPNPGLVRMNIINKLRGKIKKGHVLKW